MAEPTSGRWSYERGRVVSDAPTPREGTMNPIADLSLAFKSSAEMHANGALLAASKILLAFLEELDGLYDDYMADGEKDPAPLLDLIDSRLAGLIAKAKGEAS